MNRIYNPEFVFHSTNPYHFRLQDDQELARYVLTDNDAEMNVGTWNSQIFQNNHPIHLEIGCGYGEFMERFSQLHPNLNFIGMDFRFKRMFKLAKKFLHLGENFRLIRGRGERIQYIFAKQEIERCYLFFPDPWPKERQHKNRLIQETFLNALSNVLIPKGEFWFKTDHPGLFESSLEAIEKNPKFKIIFQTKSLYEGNLDTNDPTNHPLSTPLFRTKFETIFLKQNLPIYALVAINSEEK